MSELHLPEPFQARMQQQLGAEWPAFLNSLEIAPPVSVRNHVLKNKNLQENIDKVKWSSNGVYLESRPVFTLDPAFHAGAYYVQEASSMLVEAAVRQLCDLERPLRVLDMAAAPGGKSTLLADLISSDSLLVANEVIRSRFHILKYNLVKWGYPNTAVTNHDSRDFTGLEGWFDVLLLDAPCSGEGLFRKDPHAIQEWSPDAVRLCAARQRRILADATALLRPGGVLLYSTCTYNSEENSENVLWIAEELGFEIRPLTLPADWGIHSVEAGYQCYPHKVRGEGFFLAALVKQHDKPTSKPAVKSVKIKGWEPLPARHAGMIAPWIQHAEQLLLFQDTNQTIRAIPKSIEPWITTLSGVLPRFDWGVEVGTIKGKDFIPAPELALSTIIAEELPAVELDRSTALHFLKKENIAVEGAPAGWVLARYQGMNLGWMKVLNNRINNYYPKNWRILMEV